MAYHDGFDCESKTIMWDFWGETMAVSYYLDVKTTTHGTAVLLDVLGAVDDETGFTTHMP
jgi:hypothetical protein